MTYPVRHISVSIQCSATEVYEFASNPENLPQWASGLSGSIKNVNGDWIAESPMGPVKVRFAETNLFGVLDHVVTLSSSESFYNPMRVFSNNDGCELLFTLFRQPQMTDQDFEADAATIEKDLRALKSLLKG